MGSVATQQHWGAVIDWRIGSATRRAYFNRSSQLSDWAGCGHLVSVLPPEVSAKNISLDLRETWASPSVLAEKSFVGHAFYV